MPPAVQAARPAATQTRGWLPRKAAWPLLGEEMTVAVGFQPHGSASSGPVSESTASLRRRVSFRALGCGLAGAGGGWEAWGPSLAKIAHSG